MKVKDLIEELKELDQESIVVVRGYEGGVSSKKVNVNEIHVILNVNSEWYYGEHTETNDTSKTKAVLIG